MDCFPLEGFNHMTNIDVLICDSFVYSGFSWCSVLWEYPVYPIKDNFPTPIIDQIINACSRHESFSFMDGFSGYNQIQIRKEDHYKNAFTIPWGTFAYRVMPFGLKNIGATFQRAMTHCFHDIIHIMLVYLDNLIARSQKQAQHIDNLRQVFL